MVNQRYHIHVCLVKNEQPDFENALQIALAKNYFLTWDLIGHPVDFMSYSRQQIDKCNYVLFVLGDGYGYLSPSGVSYLHLCYVYATAKQKPLFALIKTPANQQEYSRQRADFAELIEKEQGDNIASYTHAMEAVRFCQIGIAKLAEDNPSIGWQKLPLNNRFVHHDFATSRVISPLTPHVSPIKRALSQANIVIANKQLESSTKLPDNTSFHPSTLSNTIMVSYSAHAYHDGNLKDLMLTHQFTCYEILAALQTLVEPFSTEAMLRKLNETLNKFALAEAIKILPNTHAVSRCQMNTADFQWIKKQLMANEWLLPIKEENDRSNREFWRLSEDIKYNKFNE